MIREPVSTGLPYWLWMAGLKNDMDVVFQGILI